MILIRIILILCFTYLAYLAFDAYQSTDPNIEVIIDHRKYAKQIQEIDGLVLDPRQTPLIKELQKRFEIVNDVNDNIDQNLEMDFDFEQEDFKEISSLIKQISSSANCEVLKSRFISKLIDLMGDQQIQAQLKITYQRAIMKWFKQASQAQTLYFNPFSMGPQQDKQANEQANTEMISLFDQNLIFIPSALMLSKQLEQMPCHQLLEPLSQIQHLDHMELILLYYLSPWLSIMKYDQGAIIFIPFRGVKWIKDLKELNDRSYDFNDLIKLLKDLRTRRW